MFVVMVGDVAVSVVMLRFVFSVNMCVGVDMFMLVGMQQLTVAVDMGVDVGMLMNMLQSNGIFDHQYRGDDHDNKANIEL